MTKRKHIFKNNQKGFNNIYGFQGQWSWTMFVRKLLILFWLVFIWVLQILGSKSCRNRIQKIKYYELITSLTTILFHRETGKLGVACISISTKKKTIRIKEEWYLAYRIKPIHHIHQLTILEVTHESSNTLWKTESYAIVST